MTTQHIQNLRLLLKSFYPFICAPKTDILDLAAVALGKRPVACLYMEEQALEEITFRKLAETGKQNSIWVSDLNGNPYWNNPEFKVPVWIVCRDLRTLKKVLRQHMVLQPKGFPEWAACLGKLLEYPPCCIEAYIKEVKDPAGRNAFWKKVKQSACENNEIIMGFAPCSFSCEAAYSEICGRLAIAYQLGLLDERAALQWLERKKKRDDARLIFSRERILDLHPELSPSFKIPVPFL